jgi:hypothetical protein
MLCLGTIARLPRRESREKPGFLWGELCELLSRPLSMELSCFHCNRPLRISAEQLGGEVTCPHCQGTLRLPKAEVFERQQREHAKSVTGSWLSNSVSALVSTAVHAGLLLIFALVTCDFRGGGGGQGDEVLIAELPQMEFSETMPEQLDVNEAQPDASTSDQLDNNLDVVTPMDTAGSEMSLDLDVGVLAPSGAAGAASPAMSALAGGGGALGEGASFMGVHAKGSRFCIIADNSGSMDGQKLQHVKSEIHYTLATMSSRARFQLIFFHNVAQPYPEPGWRHPRRDRTEVSEWLQRVSAGGGTNPTPAFEAAFRLSPPPDVIFFMTDGLFREEAVQEIRDLNRSSVKKVTIHTISFMDTSSEALMKRIASDSGGKYRHVPGF